MPSLNVRGCPGAIALFALFFLLNYKVSLAPLFKKRGGLQTLYLRKIFGAKGAKKRIYKY
jgi:hypothetical protein